MIAHPRPSRPRPGQRGHKGSAGRPLLHPPRLRVAAGRDTPARHLLLAWANCPPRPSPTASSHTEPEVIELDAIRLRSLYTPGHAPGHLSFYLSEQKILLQRRQPLRRQHRPHRLARRRPRPADEIDHRANHGTRRRCTGLARPHGRHHHRARTANQSLPAQLRLSTLVSPHHAHTDALPGRHRPGRRRSRYQPLRRRKHANDAQPEQWPALAGERRPASQRARRLHPYRRAAGPCPDARKAAPAKPAS